MKAYDKSETQSGKGKEKSSSTGAVSSQLSIFFSVMSGRKGGRSHRKTKSQNNVTGDSSWISYHMSDSERRAGSDSLLANGIAEEINYAERIEEYLKKEKELFEKQRREPKVLLLGSSDSGKSTLLKQMKIIHGNGFTIKDREMEKKRIRVSCLETLLTLLKQCTEFENRDIMTKYESVEWLYQCHVVENSQYAFEDKDILLFKECWTEPAIQEKFQEATNLPDNTLYFMEKIDSIYSESYLPSDDDILNVKTVTTSSVCDNVFKVNNDRLHVIDVSGLSHHRKSWVSFFDDVGCIIFIVSLSCYDQTMSEETGVNRMVDSIVLFQEMVNHKLLEKKLFVLFLNKKDVFLKKIRTKHVIDYFPKYKGEKQDAAAAIKYFDQKLRDKDKMNSKEIRTHITCCNDTKVMKVIMSSVLVGILSGKLNATGLGL